MSAPTAPRLGLLLCDDMLFTSRITATARCLGLMVKPARSVAVLQTLLQQQMPDCLILDLAHPGLDLAGLVQQLRGTAPIMPRLIAYGSHVDTATLQAAREAGCDLVLPRSKFVEELPRALPEWMSAAPQAD